MAIDRILADIQRRARKENWSAFSLEIALRSGKTIALDFDRVESGFLVLEANEHPEGFQSVYVPFEAIETMRPVWR